MLGRTRVVIQQLLLRLGYRLERVHPEYPVLAKAIDPVGVEILGDPEFQSSCREIAGLTLLDLPRLANLWQLCRISNRSGGIIEVGAYKGGSALHVSNSCPSRRVIVCDSFSGFELLDSVLDNNFNMAMFRDTQREIVERLFEGKQRNARVVAGYFPQSCLGIDLKPISFAHIDVDSYKATIETLQFLDGCMIEESLILLDDYNRKAEGVDKAIGEFVKENRVWVVFPLFPCQAVLIHKSWLD